MDKPVTSVTLPQRGRRGTHRGRRATPLDEYLSSREGKLKELHRLSTDVSLTVAERHKWYTQFNSLKKRLRDKIAAHKKNMKVK